MKELKIEIPDGYEVDKENSTFERIVFKEIKKQLPKTWEELKMKKSYYVGDFADIIEALNALNDPINKNHFVTKEQAAASIALAQLSQLREVYRDGWVPNWEDIYMDKHIIRGWRDSLNVACTYESNSFLSFQSNEIAAEFLKNFRDLIEQAKPLLS